MMIQIVGKDRPELFYINTDHIISIHSLHGDEIGCHVIMRDDLSYVTRMSMEEVLAKCPWTGAQQ